MKTVKGISQRVKDVTSLILKTIVTMNITKKEKLLLQQNLAFQKTRVVVRDLSIAVRGLDLQNGTHQPTRNSETDTQGPDQERMLDRTIVTIVTGQSGLRGDLGLGTDSTDDHVLDQEKETGLIGMTEDLGQETETESTGITENLVPVQGIE